MKRPGSKLFLINYTKEVLKKDIPRLSKEMKVLIKQIIEKKLTIDPLQFGKPLSHSLKGSRRLRVGNYRVIYIIQTPKNRVIVTAIKHRKDAYN